MDGWDGEFARTGPPLESDMELRSRFERIDHGAWARAGVEPSLEEMLADPVVGIVMERDAVTAEDVRAVIRAVDLGRIRRNRAAGVLAFARQSGRRAPAGCRG